VCPGSHPRCCESPGAPTLPNPWQVPRLEFPCHWQTHRGPSTHHPSHAPTAMSLPVRATRDNQFALGVSSTTMPSKWSPRFEVAEWYDGLRSDWKRCLRSAPTPAAATRDLLKIRRSDLRGCPARHAFWLPLAFYQCTDGCLQPIVAKRALAILDRGPSAAFWLEVSSSAERRRERDFQQLRKMILKALPSRNAGTRSTNT
jgi:hypothetical protein